jgi:Alw26I/Eco31I/Esp3I family type II restriction endonuclease
MTKPTKIVNDPGKYGSKGQAWAEDFVAYMVEMVSHRVYAGMPDAVKDDGLIQWEAPSNRKSGQYQNTHHRRRDWWREKAESVGIDPTMDQWISTVAKRIHPTGQKPCKRCGRVMWIAYVYPNSRLQKRLVQAFGSDFQFDSLEPIADLLYRVSEKYGLKALSIFRDLLKTIDVVPPSNLNDVDSWTSWLEVEYIPSEPSLLSPGAMSNAPDRLDGFHSFNLCCRKKADRGRNDANMRSYTTDRRVFEFWSDGDWIAADRMMGLVRERMRDEPCADGGDGPPTADHIGPLSLGFAHRPHFRLLSRSANSAKNNRMTLQDVTDLIAEEQSGEQVASWYAKPLWDLLKSRINTEELALRLSKVLRDNQRLAMHMLIQSYQAGHFTFLSALLGLEYAKYHVEFEDQVVSEFIPVYGGISRTPKRTKYVSEQMARRLRIGFEALQAYGAKENRHKSIMPLVASRQVERHLLAAQDALGRSPVEVNELDLRIQAALIKTNAGAGESQLREISGMIPEPQDVDAFREAQSLLVQAMSEVAIGLSGAWEGDRYVRKTLDEIDND